MNIHANSDKFLKMNSTWPGKIRSGIYLTASGLLAGALFMVPFLTSTGWSAENPALLSKATESVSWEQAKEPVAGAEEAFKKLESTLLKAKTVRIVYRIDSHGAFETYMEGELLLRTGNRARLDAKGNFNGKALNLHLLSDGEQMRGGSESGTFALDTPSHLNEGILIGITRMGLLHNLAKLASGQPPDRTDGTVREWVQVSDFTFGEENRVPDMPGRPIVVQITVSGDPVGEAMLWTDGQSGMPVQRFQKVYFGTVEMHVSETYEVFSCNEDIDPAVFQDQKGLSSDSPSGTADQP